MYFERTTPPREPGEPAPPELLAYKAQALEVLRCQQLPLYAILDAARSELAPGHVPRIVLFSDARATAGDLDEAFFGMAAAGDPPPELTGNRRIDARILGRASLLGHGTREQHSPREQAHDGA